MKQFALTLMASLVFLLGCSVTQEKSPLDHYPLAALQHLQQQKSWSLEGRLALVDEKDSVTVSIIWQHDNFRDVIELTGPLAQGHLKILVTPDQVVVDDGENRAVYSGQVESVLSQQLGVDMPVGSLKFWVLGVNDPDQQYIEQPGGFYQAGWLVRYREMQDVDGHLLPKKLTAEKDKSKIKLIVDQWVLS